jgi:hypothetical protein
VNRLGGIEVAAARPGALLAFVLLAAVPIWALGPRAASSQEAEREKIWASVVVQAKALGLPNRFLQAIPPGFVTVEFADLRTYAAQYDPETHRMLLNLPFSFNAAGGVLRPLRNLAHNEIGTLYHELFHAYMDFLTSQKPLHDPVGRRLLEFARQQQRCRYQRVTITPIVQRKGFTEQRVLTERESWEALNETWGAFVGWAIWTRLEVNGRRQTGRVLNFDHKAWLQRLTEADREGRLTGYYEPEAPEERAITQKRYLAPVSRLSSTEVAVLLELLFEQSSDQARRSAATMAQNPLPLDTGQCPKA